MFFAGRAAAAAVGTRAGWRRSSSDGVAGRSPSTGDRFRFEMLQATLPVARRPLGPGDACEGGRHGPARSRAAAEGAPEGAEADAKVMHVTSFKDPVREIGKLHVLYDSLMEARRHAGDEVVPFHKFAALVIVAGVEASRSMAATRSRSGLR